MAVGGANSKAYWVCLLIVSVRRTKTTASQIQARTDPAHYSQQHSEIAGELIALLEKTHTARGWLQEALP